MNLAKEISKQIAKCQLSSLIHIKEPFGAKGNLKEIERIQDFLGLKTKLSSSFSH